MMNNKRMTWISCLIALVLVFGAVLPAVAQEATSEPEMTGDTTMGTLATCDSSLILLAGLAQRYFGYVPEAGLDLTAFEHGQFTGLYNLPMPDGNTAANTGTTAGNAGSPEGGQNAGEGTGEAGNSGSVGGTGSASSDDMAMQAAGSGVTLSLPAIADENPRCTQLRASLEVFFTTAMMQSDWDNQFRSGMIGGVMMDDTSASE